MARTYIISEICGDWALQIRDPGHPHQFLYFNSENNANLVKSILEWEDTHQNEAVPYKPTLTPPNEPLTLEQLREMDGVTALWVHFRAWNAHKPRLMLVRKAMDGWWSCCDHNGFLTFNEKDYGNMFLLYRRPPEGEA